MEKCPECKNYSLVYDGYYQRWICLIIKCSASELSSEKIREFAKFKLKGNGNVYR